MRFRATVLLGGKTATGIEVPADVVASLGSSRRPKVRATINGFTYRSSVASIGDGREVHASCERRHRRLWLVSRPGEGSTFSFSLPKEILSLVEKVPAEHA